MDAVIIGNNFIENQTYVPVWEFVDVPGIIDPPEALGEYYDTGAVFDGKPVHKHLTAEFYQWRNDSPVPTIWAIGPSVGPTYWERDDLSAEGVYQDNHISAAGNGTFQEL